MTDARTEHSPAVQRLIDRQAIIDCLHRYTWGLDRHRNDFLASAFHADGIDEHGAFRGTIPEFVAWSEKLHDSEPWTGHTHLLDNNHIDFDDDGVTAHSETYVFFVHRRDADDEQVIEFGAGRYIDRFEQRDGDWRIAVRRLVIEWTARTEQAIFADVAHYPRGTHDGTDPSYLRPFTLDG